MKVVSIGGIENDGEDYVLWLEKPYSQPALTLEQTRREGQDPVITRARRNALVMELHCRIFGADEDETTALREALLTALDTEGTAIQLVIADSDGGNERYRYVVCSVQADEQDEGEGTGQYLVATLVTHGETRWRSTTASNTTWNITGSGETTVVANGGSLPARPVYTIQPTNSKASPGNSFLYRRFCAVKWGSWNVTHYPVDVTAGVWDTDALTTAKVSAETNIAVVVDGRMVKRWIANYDTTTTGVWVNLDFAWQPLRTFLAAGMGSGDTVTAITATEEITGFPLRGLLQVNNELFTYESKDDVTRTFHGVSRAARGSTAADHDADDEIHWIQHDIWVLYGSTGYWQNTYDNTGPDGYGWMSNDIYKPVMDLDSSTNSIWYFNLFGESGDENKFRSGSWRRGGPTEGTLTIDDPYDEIVATRADSFAGTSGYSYWELVTAYRLGAMRIIGRGANYEPGKLWRAGMWVQGVEYLSIPEPVPGNEEFALVDFDLSVTAVAAGYEMVRFETRSAGAMEARLDQVWLYYDEYPTVLMMPEETMYDLALTLANTTTGQSITLTLAMALGEQLEIDTENHTVTLLDDGTSQYQALERSTRRKEILPLAPGNNTLQVTEDGLDGVTVFISFEARTYS